MSCGNARRTEFAFAPGEGDLTESESGGSVDQPAVSHRYEAKGTYRVLVASVWSATVTMSGPGFVGRPTAIGQAIITDAIDYPVVEVRSTLTQ